MSDQPSRLEVAFARSIERRREVAAPIRTRDDLYGFVNHLRGEGIPVEATAAVLDFDPADFRRWLAGDVAVQYSRPRVRAPQAPARPRPVTAGPVSSRAVSPSERRHPAPSDDLQRAFEGPVRKRAAELFPEPPRNEAGWFPLVRMLAGEGVPVDVSTAILGVNVEAYRLWMADGRLQITSTAGYSGRPA